MRGSTQEIAQYLAEDFWREYANDIPRSFDLASEGGTVEVNVTGLTGRGQDFARLALDEWSAVSGVAFAEVSAGGDIAFSDSEDDYAQTLWSYSNDGTIASASINIPASVIDSDPAIGDVAYTLYLHEVGHALGLGHPGPYNEIPDGEDAADPSARLYENDTYLQSVTSYFPPTDDPEAQTGFARPVTPMATDIAAMQILYGTSSIRAGDTVYGGSSNTAGTAFASFDTGMLATIADTGGTDLLDLSNVSASMNLSLRQGATSTFRGANDGGLVIAKGAIVENAIGTDQNDEIRGSGYANVLRGSAGADEIHGNDGGDRISGNDGSDTLHGNAGTDVLRGGASGDVLYGNGGNDTLNGNDGLDRLYGGDEADTLRGGSGSDTLVGGNGRDRLFGNDDADTLRGSAGNDVLNGNAGSDTLNGNDGRDRLYGGDEADALRGGAGGDTLYGGNGRDRLFGNDDADALRGGARNDLLNGNAGDDTLVGNDGLDRLYGGDGDDTLESGSGSDTLYGSNGDDRLSGNDGADTLRGGAGNDVLNANAGADTLNGNDGQDRLYGGDENDTLRGGSGGDALFGGKGNDWLFGHRDDDTLYGGDDADTFVFSDFHAGEVDTVADFQTGLDVMRMVGVDGGFDALSISSAQAGSEVAYQGHTIVLEGLQANQIDADDFVFV